jgi:hypothetical protein
MTKRPVSMDAGTLPSAAGQPVEGEPTPAQVTTYKMARVCLIEGQTSTWSCWQRNETTGRHNLRK